jgi:hypothetical protein
LCLLSSNVWFSGDKDKDEENDTVAMYVYFHKVKERVQIEKCRVLFTQYEFHDTFFILMNSHGKEANVYNEI